MTNKLILFAVKVTCILILLHFCTIVVAKKDVTNPLVNQLHQAYQGINYYQADFIQQKNVKFLSKPLVSEGSLKFAKDIGLIWEIKKPLQVKTLVNQTGIYKSTAYAEKREVKDLQMKIIAEVLTELLSAKLDRVESNFNIDAVEIDESDGKWMINLSPTGLLMKKSLNALRITGQNEFNDDSALKSKGIYEIQIVDNAFNKTTILIKNALLSNAPVSASIRTEFE